VLDLDAAAGPVLTYCDDATGERTELTAADLGDWAARTAGLLRDGCGLVAGDRAAVLLPPHWQTAAVLLGAWSIGVAVSFRPWATAGLAPASPDGPLDAVFVSRQRLDSWLETVPAARHRFVVGPPAEGYRDYLAEVAGYPAAAPAYWTVPGTATASPDGTTYEQWAEIARGIAGRLGLRAGDRLLVDVATTEQPVAWLLAPLSAGASILLCANLDSDTLDARIAAEGVTHVLR
jgi:uncharacterized protein (TIGR03089 family)